MKEQKPTYEELEARLAQAEETLRAIRSGSIDAIVGDQGMLIMRAKAAEDALRETQKTLEAVVETAPILIVMTDSRGRIVLFNRACEELTGYSRQEVLGKTIPELFLSPEWVPIVAERFADPFNPALQELHINPWITKTGEERLIEWRCKALPMPRGTGYFVLGTGLDITERKRAEEEREKLEAQLRQAQKMEAVGRLAGGVAHDFNNMLTTILGYADLALREVSPESPLHDDLLEIVKAAQRSADLTRQLLAFARRQTVNPIVLDLNDAVSGLLKMLRRLIGEDIDLIWMPGHDLWPVKIDPSQVDQLLANLAVNARDAITGVGKITIETHNVVLDEAYCVDHVDFLPGEYVMLAVSDTGVGMSKEVLEHLFEPFFTTKEVGKGTGLGLATVYGIVKQNDGFINVYSEPGQGTTFKIYLPRSEAQSVEIPAEKTAEPLWGGRETVLIVEDEKAILDIGERVLEGLGYTVLVARSPNEAIRLAEEHVGDIHLLITDVVMPEMNGRDLAEQLTSIRPGIKCLYMSGYTANVIAQRGVLNEGVCFIQKPFSAMSLAVKVREALEQAS
ncbi:MAG: PAS domain S-box protein [Anaerolineae bacterium]|jgi:PAS domain S-box-containing protein|nr:PAS domain S-box protein [Anaerolineae bacterium]MDH7472609.1 PAS domain S-box protein [Anaerolineae bacterium]